MSSRQLRFLVAGVVVAVLVVLLRCSVDERSPTLIDAPVASVEVSPANPSVAVNGNLQLTAIVRDASGNGLLGHTVTWRSEDSTKVAVTSTGLITGRALGTAGVTASSAGKSTTIQVTVLPQGAPIPTAGLDLVLLTYLGGSERDMLRDIATDPQGNVYIAGSTASPNFPVANALDATFGANTSGFQDAFVGKMTPAGQVLWLTYLGNSGFERIYALEVDAQGFIYVAGRAGPNFPVTPGVFQQTFSGGPGGNTYGEQDGFVCKLRPDGAAIVFCSYFGDTDGLAIRDIAIDAAGDIYVVGGTRVGTFPAAWFTNGFQKQYRGGEDVVVAKVAGNGSRIIWATYLGGSDDDIATATVRLDASNNVVVFFGTRSPDLPTPGGFDHTFSGVSDGYLAKVSADGARLLWATYLGGTGNEISETHALAIASNGDVIVAAGTTSPDYPTTAGVVQPTFGGVGSSRATGVPGNYPGDMVISRVSSDGTRLLASTYLGGNGGDGAEGVSIDPAGNIVVSGTTYSPNFPVTANIPQAGSGLRGDVALVKLSPDLTRLMYSVRLGGSEEDWGRITHVDHLGNVYLGGEIGSSNMPTLNAFQQSRGNWDAMLAKLIPK